MISHTSQVLSGPAFTGWQVGLQIGGRYTVWQGQVSWMLGGAGRLSVHFVNEWLTSPGAHKYLLISEDPCGYPKMLADI